MYGGRDSIRHDSKFLLGVGPDNLTENQLTELVAFSAIHEVAHGKGQRDIDLFFSDIEQDTILDSEQIKRIRRHCYEIDADVSAYHILEDNAVKGQLIEQRFIVSFLYNMEDRIGASERTEEVSLPLVHDTAYFIKFYNDSGYMPNYFQTCLDLDGFYDKTCKALEVELGDQFTSSSLYSSLDDRDFEIYASVVNTLLASDPPVYSPNEEMVAREFLECLEVNGTELRPINEVRDSMDLGQPPLMNPNQVRPDTISAPKSGGNR